MKFQIFARRLMAGAALTLVSAPAFAQVTPVSLGTPTYTQNFNGLATTGNSKVLPAGWAIEENGSTSAGSDDAYATSNTNAGTINAFGTGSERALGSVTSGNATPNLFGAFFTNDLGGTIESLSLDFFGEQWRLGTAVKDVLSFEYSTDATSLGDGSWTKFSLLDFASLQNGTGSGSASNAIDGNAAANRAEIAATITGLMIANGGHFAFRWTDLEVGGSDHGLAIDDLTLTAGLTPTSPVPEPAAWALMIGGFGLAGAALRRRAARVAFA